MQELNEEQKAVLAQTIINLMDQWELDGAQQLKLLDLPEGTPKRALRRFREGEPLPDDPGVEKRVRYIIGIADALRTTYPTNAEMGRRWMINKNRRFHNRPPVAVMVEGGESGLISVLAHLDCTYAWDLTGSKG